MVMTEEHSNFKVSQGTSNQSLKNYNYGFICDAIFFTCTHVHISLGNGTYLLLKVAELEIRLVCMETGRVFVIHCCQYLNRAWSTILQPILHTSNEEACEDRLTAL